MLPVPANNPLAAVTLSPYRAHPLVFKRLVEGANSGVENGFHFSCSTCPQRCRPVLGLSPEANPSLVDGAGGPFSLTSSP